MSPERPELIWRCRDRVFDLSARTLLMGVVNVTPDSFSDGGRYLDAGDALAQGLALVREGAALVDVGGLLRAFDDRCTHRGCSLAEGTVDASSVTCPCHRGRFDLATGVALDGPPVEPIRIRVVRLDGDRVFVER